MKVIVKRTTKNRKSIFVYMICLCLLITSCLDSQTVYAVFGKKAPVQVADAETKVAKGIPLKKISGSGTGFIYHHFVETTNFKKDATYALLDDVYSYEDAVASLGAGAVLKTGSEENNSIDYIKGKYGDSATVKTYVDVITKGKQFDSCKIGGLYAVPGTSGPTEYRYFCGYGGAQDCGPLYAYTYEKVALGYESISASLNRIDKQGSTKASDYTVILTYEDKDFVLDTSSYRIEISDADSDAVTIIVQDSEGNEITTHFSGPLAVRYDGNAKGVTGVPSIQEIWKGKSCTISNATPARTGYAFQNWKDKKTGTVYTKGQTVASPSKCLWLQAQWKDTQKPVVNYTPVEVMKRTSDTKVKEAVKQALTITDNEPVSECTVTVEGSNIAASAGDKIVTVTVRDKAGNTTTKKYTIKVLPLPLQFQNITFDESSKRLQATLYEPGPDAVKETGFVWGIMSNPTISLNNGKASTSPAVTSADGVLRVTAENLQKGVNYYARAYAVAGDITYYSEEITIGIGIPSFGTFTISNNGNNTFTVTRADGTEGVQTVYYRTVNGSAVGGTHFQHKADSLTFQAGETTKTITITETGANIVYNGKAATAYSNRARTYEVELYRVTGGGTLGNTVRATRQMKSGTNYSISFDIYSATTGIKTQTVTPGDDKKWVADRSNCSDGDLFLVNNRDKNNNPLIIDGSVQKYDKKTLQKNFSTSYGIASCGGYTNEQITYLRETTEYFLYRQKLTAKEDEDAWSHIWIGDHVPPCANMNNHAGGSFTNQSIPLDASDSGWNAVVGERMGNGLYSASFSMKGASSVFYFPNKRDNGGVENEVDGSSDGLPNYSRAKYCIDYKNGTWVKVPFDKDAQVYYGANGKKEDIWHVESVQNIILPYDDKEPQLLGVAPMAGGLYKQGDTFTVSLIFDEIVDSTKSSGIGSVFLNTSWGVATYAGGADTNVLYFSGTVGSGADTTLKVNSISGAANIKDMCDASATACAGGSGSVTAQVDTSLPAFTVASNGISNGTGTAKITVNADKAKTSSLRYAWSESAAMPVTGWVEADASELASAKTTAGLPLSIRKQPGSGDNGKWYLHVIGTYDTNGATTYKTTVLDFGTPSSPVAGSVAPSLEVSTDNTNWATARSVAVRASGGQTVKYRRMGETAWKTLSLNQGTASPLMTENGYYTFMLTAGDQTVTKSVQVEKIDRKKPNAGFGSLVENGTTETAKTGVYTKITLPVQYADEDSGVRTVQYAWTNTTGTPSSWKTLSGGASQVTYTAAESVKTTKYLHLKVTDMVGYEYTCYSLPYQVISQNAVNNMTPGITLTGAPTVWTNDMPTLSWELSNHEGKNYTVLQPDGKTVTAADGHFLATQNGTYTVVVQDEEYGGIREASLTIDKLDITPPEMNVTGVSNGWKSSAQTVTLNASDSQSGVGAGYYGVAEGEEEKPEDDELTGFSGGRQSVELNQNGTWYVYYRCFDRAGDDVLGRPANQAEGFAGPVRIDTTKPALSVTGGEKGIPAEVGLNLGIHAGYGPSGGTMQVGDTVLPELGAGESAGSTGPIVDGSYRVTDKGDYVFLATSGAGVITKESVTVYQADFLYQNGEETQSQLAVKGGKLTKPEEPLRAGYVFTGWYTDADGGTEWNFEETPLNDNIKLYAHWKANKVTVQPYKDGEKWLTGAPSYTLKQADGETVITDLGAVPNGTWKVFEGETDTGVSVTVQDAPQDVRMDYYTVTFYDGEEKTSTAVVREGTPVAEPPALLKTGHSFERWAVKDSEEAFDFTTAITGTTNLYAVWSQNGYKLTFEYGGATGGNEVENTYVKYGNPYDVLPVPEKTGYTFKGWYTEPEGRGSLVTAETTVTALTDHSLYAYWLDETPPEAPVLPEGVTLPADWTNQTKLPLVLKDGVGVSELLVRVDDGEYEPVPDFESGSTEYSYPVLEGEHSYQFIAKDTAGNQSAESPLFVMKVDLVSPEAEITLGVNRWNSFLNDITFGLFFDEVQTVTINSSDNSGFVGEVSYYLSDKEVADTSQIKDWQPYTDTVSVQPGKYVIYAKVTDVAGNTVIINSNGLVIDTAAPDVKIGNQPVKDQKTYYDEKVLTVEDEWLDIVKINENDITDEMIKNGSVTLQPTEGTLTITAADKSGNTVSYTINIEPKKEQKAPEGLTGISETVDGKRDGSITGLTADMEFRREGDTEYTRLTADIIPDGTLGGLEPGTYYVRLAETETSHASSDSTPIVIQPGKKLTVTFMVDGAAVVIKTVSYDEELTDIPAVPEKEGFTGKWCDETGKDAVYEHIQEDIIITAVYTKESVDPEETEKPGETQKPGETEKPDETQKPEETEKPDETQRPEETQKPHATPKPEETAGTSKPVSSPEPNVPGQPKEPDRPEKTKKPENTKKPRKSGQTEGTKPDRKSEEAKRTDNTRVPGRTEETDNTGTTGGLEKADNPEVTPDAGGGKMPEDNTESAAFSGKRTATGNLRNMENTKTELSYGSGKVVVTVVCDEKELSAGVTDTEAVARMVLTPEQLALVRQGETVEIEIHVKDISSEVPEEDKKIIENGIQAERDKIPGLTLGAYVDITMVVRVGENEWQPVSQTKEPVEVVVGIPESLQSADREYAIMRAHDGEYALLRDGDKEQDTITIQTGMFSTYAIVYGQSVVEASPTCGLCHICPTFLGICCFIWLIFALLVMAAVLYMHRRKQQKKKVE